MFARPLAGIGLLLLAACSPGGNTIAGRAQGQGYISGDGRIERLDPDARTTVITLAGPTLTGAALNTGDWRGSVVVVNTWGSWCAPCNAEAPVLAAAATSYAKRGVKFVGVNLREDPPTALAFNRKFGLDYPSFDGDGPFAVQLKGKASATPTTLILDPQGRLAARISGEVDRATLTGLVDDVLAESKPGPT
jgi:thiol-disulfide isomerase/thioredoxin